MKPTTTHLLLAALLLSPTTATASLPLLERTKPLEQTSPKRLIATVVTELSTLASSTFNNTCAHPRDTVEEFEAAAAWGVRGFSDALQMVLRDVHLKGMKEKQVEVVVVKGGEKEELRSSADWMQDGEGENELKKRQKPRGQTLGHTPIKVTMALARPCNELHRAIRIFNRNLQSLVYSVAEQCGGKCVKGGSAHAAIKELEEVHKSQGIEGRAGGFVGRLRMTEKEMRCTWNFQANELDINEYAINKVKRALLDGEVPWGLRVQPCKDAKAREVV